MAARVPPILKDILALVLVFTLIIGGLYAFTGVWPPAVIVESKSMMHPHEDGTFGLIGTIDPGDLVLVKDVEGPGDVATWADDASARYGMTGDVIVFLPNGNPRQTPIIHRAMAWVDVDSERGEPRYHVRWDPADACPGGARRSDDGASCVWGADGITVQEFGLNGYHPERAGFITKGDNPTSNPTADQVAGLTSMVRMDWVQGKARGELPWLGLVKLALAPKVNEKSPEPHWWRVGNAYAPPESWIMLGVSLFVLIGLPLGYDAWRLAGGQASSREAPREQPAPGSREGHEDGPEPADETLDSRHRNG